MKFLTAILKCQKGTQVKTCSIARTNAMLLLLEQNDKIYIFLFLHSYCKITMTTKNLLSKILIKNYDYSKILS